MRCYQRKYSRRKCLCCKHCSKCQDFTKVIAGNYFDIYIYVNSSKDNTNGDIMAGNNGFVFTNICGTPMNINDLLRTIESNEFNCQRCKSIFIRVSNMLKELIQENKIVVICASCVSRCISDGLCKLCHRIYDNFISTKKLEHGQHGMTTNAYANKWSSAIEHLLSNKREAMKILPFEEESQNIITAVTHSFLGITEANVDVKLSATQLNLKLKSDPQVITKDLSSSYLSQTHVDERNAPEPINEILKEHKNLEGFVYVFPKKDLERYDLKKRISSSLLIKEIQEKVIKEGRDDIPEGIKMDEAEIKNFKNKKVRTLKSKRVYVDAKISPSTNKGKTPKKHFKDKGENEVYNPERIKNQEEDIDIKDKSGTVPRVKRKVKKYPKSSGIVNGTHAFETMKKGEESGDGSPNLSKIISKKNNKEDKQKLSNRKKNTLKGSKSLIKDRVQSLIEVDQHRSPSTNKGKTLKKHLKDKGEKEVYNPERIKNQKKDIDIKDEIGTVLRVKRKENKYSKSSDILNGTHAIETMKNGEESGDGFLNLLKIISKKENKEEKQKLSNRKKNTLKGSKSLINDPVQSLIEADRHRSTVGKRVKQKSGQSELKIGKKKKTPEIKKNDKSASTEELKLSRVKIRNASVDSFLMDMVKVKQSVFAREKPKKPKRLSDLKISPLIIQQHKSHQSGKMSSCIICTDSELEIDIDELLQKDKLLKVSEIIMGQKIVKNKKPRFDKTDKNSIRPILFESTLEQFDTKEVIQDGSYQRENIKSSALEKHTLSLQNFMSKSKKSDTTLRIKSEQDAAKGGIHYKLSNRSFINKGWTMLPTEKIVRKLNVYRMRPSHPEFDWFEHNKSKRLMHYDTGETLAEFSEDGRGKWFYKNGRLALDYYNAEEMNAGQRYVVYSNGEPDDKGRPRPITVLATFDYLGNGIVFDHTGRVRLKYNQTEGVVVDKDIGPVSHWKWHELNDPPVLLKVMIDTQMAVKDPEILKLGGIGENVPRADNEEMLAIEFDNFIKEKSKKLSQKFKPFQIKMKALKINENFSLRVLDQATVYLTFRDGSTNLKLNLGMILNHKEIVDTDTAEVGEVTCNLERFPARTDSLAMLQRSVAHAQQIEKLRIERERRFKLSKVKPSVDRLTAVISRPLKLPVLTEPEVKCMCSTRKRLSE